MVMLVPRLWSETIEAHRREVRDAILDAAADLVAQQGLTAVTMSQIAAKTGIGRATLYKYFPDVEAILVAWHERHVASHLERLAEIRNRTQEPGERLEAALQQCAAIQQQRAQHGHAELAAFLHRGEHVAGAHRELHAMIRDLLADAVETGDVRDDVPRDELAAYCLRALGAAGDMPSTDAAHRLVAVIRDGLRPGS